MATKKLHLVRLRLWACALIAILGPAATAPLALLWHNSAPAEQWDRKLRGQVKELVTYTDIEDI